MNDIRTVYSAWDWLIWALLGGTIIGCIGIMIQEHLRRKRRKPLKKYNITRWLEKWSK